MARDAYPTDRTAPVSVPQLQALWSLGQYRGRDEATIRAYVTAQYGCAVEALTRVQASAVIEWAKRPQGVRR